MRELKDLTVKGMALVKSPANRKRFLMHKSEDSQVAQTREAVVKAAPSDVVSAVRAIKLAKGEDEQASDALEAVGHLLHANPQLSLSDVLAAGRAAGLADVEKAAPKKSDEDDEYEDDEDEMDEGDESDDDEEEDIEDDEDEDEGKKMPAKLREKLKKSDFDESKHPRDDHGRFGEGGGGSGGSSKELSSAAKEASKKADSFGYKVARGDRKAAAAAHEKAADLHSKAASAIAEESKSSSPSLFGGGGYSDVSFHNRMADAHSSRAIDLGSRARTKKSQFADSSANQEEPSMADVQKAKEREFVSKSEYDEMVERVAKAHERLEKMEQEDALRVEKSANQSIYGDLKVDHDALARTTLALRKSAPKDLEALEATLKAANEQVRVAKTAGGSIFRASSSQPYVDGAVAKRQGDQFKQLVDEYMQKNAGSTRKAAIAEVAKSADAINQYKQLEAEG